jgi:hypothetical protein
MVPPVPPVGISSHEAMVRFAPFSPRPDKYFTKEARQLPEYCYKIAADVKLLPLKQIHSTIQTESVAGSGG